MGVSIIQLNCAGAAVVMYDVGAWMCEHQVQLAILQEPWTAHGQVKGLPASMRVFSSQGSALAAIVVNHNGFDCAMMEHLTTECGVCVHVKGSFGEIYVVSVY